MANQKLAKTLGVYTCISIVIGGVIGSGIFMKPAVMAGQLGSAEWLILTWMIAGVITLFGALSNAEVAAMLPETGGQFVFFQHMYGDFVAFIYGWSAFAVFNTAGNASIAYVLGTYIEYFITLPRLTPELERTFSINIPFVGSLYPLQNIGVKTVTICVVIILSFINYRSTKAGGNVQVIFTFLKVVAIALVIGGLVFAKEGDTANLFSTSSIVQNEGWAWLGGFVLALSGAFWGYDGWNNITFVAGEIENPQRNIPLSLMVGLITCIVIYTLINIAYLYVLPIDDVMNANLVAATASEVAFGAIGGGIIALIVIVSIIGTTNANILATARVSFAMAQDGKFFHAIGTVHPRFNTPGNALVLHAIYTSLLVLSGSFDMLTDMLIFVSWMFYGLSALGIFILRFKMPDATRPYKVWGYPFVPGVFVLFTLFFLIATLVTDIINFNAGRTQLINSLFGLILASLGIPLYWYFRKVNKTGK